MVAIMNSAAEPCRVPKPAAIFCGILAMVNDHKNVLAVLVMNNTIPACAAVLTMTRAELPAAQTAIEHHRQHQCVNHRRGRHLGLRRHPADDASDQDDRLAKNTSPLFQG